MRQSVFCVVSLLVFLVGLAAVRPSPASGQEEWTSVSVPSAWKKPSGKIESAGKGYAWYRCALKLPDSWDGQPLELFAEAADDARQYYFNGRRVATMGEFPPNFRSGLGISGRYPMAADQIELQDTNVFAIRVYQEAARPNFNVAPPALFGPDRGIRMEGEWEFHVGDLPVEQVQQGVQVAAFEKLEEAAHLEQTLWRLEGDLGPLAPAEALDHFTVPDDLQLDVVASEPEVRQPLSFKWDARGRMWVMQYLQYPSPAGLKAVSRDKHLRTVYDKVPPAPPNHFPGRDKITIHEDTNGDGRYDQHKTFVDGLSIVSSFAIGRGGVWVLNPPYLLFYPDRNGDDVPDGDPEVHLEGFGIEDSHSVANSLRWGPDGWLYAAQGSTVTGHIKKPSENSKPEDEQDITHSMGQLIWRYHPEQRRYEIFAEGGGNSFGVEFDSRGNVFSGHNGGNTRGFHYVQGGYFRKGFGKHGELSNPHAYGYFEHMAHHNVPRFTHTFVIYEADTLPADYHGKLFGVGPLQSHVVISDMERDRSSFKTKDIGHAITSKDQWFRPVDIQVGPDGGVYIADFYEQRIDHSSHHQGRIHRKSGRIYRLQDPDADALPAFDLHRKSSPELVEMLRHPNKWFRQTTLRLLGDRRDASILPRLKSILAEETGQIALEALWALNLSGGFDEAYARTLLEHAEPLVRSWTVRLLGDRRQVEAATAEALSDRAYREDNVLVRQQMAATAQRLPAGQALPVVVNLWQHSEDAGDIYIPLLLWWAVESKADTAEDQILALLDDPQAWQSPMVQEHLLARLMRRFASGDRQDLFVCAELLKRAPDQPSKNRLMAGFEQAFEGRTLAGLPQPLLAELAEAGGGSLALQLRQADPAAIEKALQIVADPKASKKDRIQYLQVFGQTRQTQAVEVLVNVALGLDGSETDIDVRSAALAALQTYNQPQVFEAATKLLDTPDDDLRQVAQSVLASRRSWSRQYLHAVDAGRIDKEKIPLSFIRQLLLHSDEQIQQLVAKHWGSVQGATTDEMKARIADLIDGIHSGSGNPYNGKRLFAANCGKCHILFNEGGKVGPDLTAYKRDDLTNMLVNVVNPSLEIREGFETYVVFTEDGRALSGFIADQDNQVVVLKGVDGQSNVVPREEIEEMRATRQSVMPEGLLKDYDVQQVRDLFAYLRATQPLP